MDLDALDPERVEALFSQHGALAITLRDAGDEPVLEPGPGETPLWRETSITGLFDADRDLAPLKSALRDTFALERLPAWRTEELADRAWEREWLRDYGPMQFGERLWVMPLDAPPPPGEALVVRLDPGLAFGTGTHATTALCLRWLDGLDLTSSEVLDYGCGSGILAIAALKCGAAAATAIDIDRQAIVATQRNAIANGVADQLQTALPDDADSGRFDIVIANILAGPLVELSSTLTGRLKPGGHIALSGILAEQAETVLDAYAADVTPGSS